MASELSRSFNKRAAEVAIELLKIFLQQGAPIILHSDNGREFTADVIKELVALWPESKLVHGRPRHPQRRGSIERCWKNAAPVDGGQ